jgi:hypothetical protein
MFRAGDTEEINRSKPEVVAAFFVERELDLLIAVSPFAVVAPLLKAAKVGRTASKKHRRPVTLDFHF